MAMAQQTELQLVAIDGDVEAGTAVALYPEEALTIGRSSRGLRLPDPLVSIHHARIDFDTKRGYVLTDLDSATGTWVDDECVKNESRPIGLGMRLRFGDSVFEVRRRRRYPWWVTATLTATFVFAIMAFVVVSLAGRIAPPTNLLKWSGPIRQSSKSSSDLLAIDPTFARERGVDVRELRIRRVTDRDYDGLDEVWFRHGADREYVVTFTPDGQWVDLGELPLDCHDQAPGMGGSVDGFPALDCQGTTYLMVDGKYRPSHQEGIVVWTRRADPDEPDGAEPAADRPARPARVVMQRPAQLAGFLAARGVNDQIHYLICEDAFTDIRAQVLTAAGEIKELGVGCLSSFTLSDDSVGKPVAIAFTANGHRALLDDLRTFYAGNADGVFLTPEQSEVVDAAARSPGYVRGAVKLSVNAESVMLEPVAQERAIPSGRVLIASKQRSPASAPAATATIVTEGVADVDAPGCASLRLTSGPFACYGACRASSTFLTVEEVGCGEPRAIATVNYGGGVVDVPVDGLSVRVWVEAASDSGRSVITRARVAWRREVR